MDVMDRSFPINYNRSKHWKYLCLVYLVLLFFSYFCLLPQRALTLKDLAFVIDHQSLNLLSRPLGKLWTWLLWTAQDTNNLRDRFRWSKTKIAVWQDQGIESIVFLVTENCSIFCFFMCNPRIKESNKITIRHFIYRLCIRNLVTCKTRDDWPKLTWENHRHISIRINDGVGLTSH